MRILILGDSYSAKRFFELFSQNKENIVFSTIPEQQNYIEFNSTTDILDFCEANEINFVLVLNNDLINQGIEELLTSINITVFSPTIDANIICSSKSYAKRFIYKNKIQSPKFQILEKPQLAIEYLRKTDTVQVIKPDASTYRECPKFVETLSFGEEVINNLFSSGNERIIIEDYVEGKNISVWTLSDGYNVQIIGTSAKYQNNVALFEPDFINDELKNRLYREAIIPTIQALSDQEEEYIGILGFDFIITYDNRIFLLGYNNFFDDINVDFYINGFDIDWLDVFNSTIIGDVFQKYTFINNQKYMLTLRQNEKIELIEANTKNNLELYLDELSYDKKEYEEAKKIWKY